MDQTRSRIGWAGSGLALGGAVAGLAAVALGAAALAPWRGSGVVRVDDVVVSAVAALGAAVCAWLALSCALGAACLVGRVLGIGWRGGEAALRRWAPGVVRRLVAAAVGGGLALGLAATGASATSAPLGDAAVAGPAAASAVAGPSTADAPATEAPPLAWTVTAPGPAPQGDDRSGVTDGPDAGDEHDEHDGSGEDDETRGRAPARTPHAPRESAPRDVPPAREGADRSPGSAEAQASGTVVVRPGDSLWTIAAERLGPAATPADVAAAWPAWYEANRDVIGSDPDVIVAGQVLVAPGTVR